MDGADDLRALLASRSAHGLARDGQPPQYGTVDPGTALSSFDPSSTPASSCSSIPRRPWVPWSLRPPSADELEKLVRDTAEATAPAVLWIDEIEKSFAGEGGRGDAGVSSRLLGTFLRWMQDRPAGVFIVATANDVTAPPRVPSERAVRRDLLRRPAHRAGTAGYLSPPPVATGPRSGRLRPGGAGSGRRRLLRSGDRGRRGGRVLPAYAAGRSQAQGDLLAEVRGAVPLSRSRAENVQALRAWACDRAVRVS